MQCLRRICPALLILSITGSLFFGHLQAFGAIRQSIVYVIHEDSRYQYYVGNKRHNAASEMLAGAKETASNCRDCEVFIFRFKAFGTGFCFMAKSDLKSYYFRNGKKIVKQTSHRHSLSQDLVARGNFYRKHTQADSKASSYFIFFGHQIPEQQGMPYSASYMDDTFSINDLASGIRSFQRRFNGILLASPESGTPLKVSALSPYSDYILASASNLGLPYLGLTPPHFAPPADSESAYGYLQDLAESSFYYLSDICLSPVSVVLYDTKKVAPYLRSILNSYLSLRRTQAGISPGYSLDCLSFPELQLPGYDEGVTGFFQGGVWGKERSPESHSGWSCPAF